MGIGLATIEAGEGGRPLLLVHGFTGAKEDFAEQLPALAAAGWHTVAPDLPGHGQSHPAGATFGFDAYAAALLALADDLGWPTFALVGHSMGGVVAQHLAFEAATRLSHLVLMDTTPGAVDIDPEVLDLACHLVATEGLGALLELQRALGSPLDTEPARRLRQQSGWQERSDAKFLRCSPEMYVTMARRLTSAPDRSARLASLHVPTLVLVGEDDRLLRGPAERLAAALPDAELVVLPDAGHSPQVENPDAWFETVARFLARSGAASADH